MLNDKFSLEDLVKLHGADEISMDNAISQMASQMMEKRNQIIELFCQTFIAAQEILTPSQLRELFANTELECIMGKDFSQTFRIKIKDRNDETV